MDNCSLNQAMICSWEHAALLVSVPNGLRVTKFDVPELKFRFANVEFAPNVELVENAEDVPNAELVARFWVPSVEVGPNVELPPNTELVARFTRPDVVPAPNAELVRFPKPEPDVDVVLNVEVPDPGLNVELPPNVEVSRFPKPEPGVEFVPNVDLVPTGALVSNPVSKLEKRGGTRVSKLLSDEGPFVCANMGFFLCLGSFERFLIKVQF